MKTRIGHGVLLALVCLGIYANGFEHAFVLDDAYTIVSNPKLRSLRNVPSYFSDPSTYTSLRAHVDYRPVLQVTYALDYWLGGYRMWWWHLTQVLLHLCCVLGLYALCRQVLARDPGDARGLRASNVALAAALLYAVHPTASGVVNYQNARSSLLTDAFLFPALVLYLASAQRRRAPWPAALLYALALWTKVEAVGALGVLVLVEVRQRAREGPASIGFLSALRRALDRRGLVRLAPFLALTAAYFVVRWRLMSPYPFEETRRAADVGPYPYLLTQTVAWWHYVGNWFAPTRLVADDLAFPVRRSLADPVVMLALAGWALVAAFLAGVWRTRPYLPFLALSALAILSPTSSVAPLSEMVNEHRPYMPLAVLSLAWVIPLAGCARVLAARGAGARVAFVAVFVFLLVAFGSLTWQRNQVFRNNRSYWEDVVQKAPSARSHLNYGLTYMQAGDYRTALDHFQRSLAMAPYWHITHINLAIAKQALGDRDAALVHLDEAVKYDEFTGAALSYRGEHSLARGRYREAVADFERSIPKSLESYRNAKGLATAWAGLGDAAKSIASMERCLALDPEQAPLDIVAISSPYFESPERTRAGILFFESLRARLPDAWWVYANLETLAGRAGDHALAEQARKQAERLRK